MKTCSKCKVERSKSDFGVLNTASDGLRYNCKQCGRDYAKKYRDANPDKTAESCAKWNKDNKDRLAFLNKRWNRENPDKKSAKDKTYRDKNKKKMTAYLSDYRKNNKEELNKKAILRRRIDPAFKLSSNIRSRVSSFFSGRRKSASTQTLLGCTFEHARAHIEKQFTKGMSWDNHGIHGWHIDHIIPCSSFDMSDPAQQRRCFHYTNLQPLWAKDNLRKNNSMPDNHQEQLAL